MTYSYATLRKYLSLLSLSLLLASLGFTPSTAQATELVDQLREHLSFSEYTLLPTPDDYEQVLELRILQDQDHDTRAIDSFYQRIWIGHRSLDAPTVYVTSGYAGSWRPHELADMLEANLVIVEYRYYGKSVPTDYDWSLLTNDQAADDLHFIRRALGKIYKGDWVSTGISKGGTTACIYRARYPKDVCATVSYVGPMPYAQEDDRMDQHLLEVGSDECRAALQEFQRRALSLTDQIVPLIDSLATAQDLSFKHVDHRRAHEYAVLELPFSFWQYAHECDGIPSADASAQEAFNYLEAIVSYSFYSDASYEYYLPAFYQFVTENGYYGFITDHLEDLLTDPADSYHNIDFGPDDVSLAYDTNYMPGIIKRLDRKGKRMIYIHGAYDPWAACAYVPRAQHRSVYIAKAKAGHTTRIKDLSASQQEEVLQKLLLWID